MIGVPHADQTLVANVVLTVGGCDDDVAGARGAEQDPFERVQPRRVHVLDHLHQHGGVIVAEAVVGVGQRTVKQVQPFASSVRQSVEVQPARRERQRARRYIHTGDLCEHRIVQQRRNELS